MNILNKNRKESGVGLIEILIVLVVLVIGWAAIAALQGKLISGSSVSKARNIALELAREKTEEMRGAIEKGQYDAALVTGSVAGEEIINATFTRSWVLGDVTLETGATVDHLKQLVMTVTWKGNEYDPDKDNLEKVVLNSMIAFADPLRSTSLVTGGSDVAGKLAPPNSESGREGPGTVVGEPDLDKDWDGDETTKDDNVYTGVDEVGNLVVYQGGAIDGVFTDGLTVYGGKILTISGTIYYDDDIPFVRATSPSLCSSSFRTKIECGTGDTAISCAKYVCYVGGDCSNGGEGCPADPLDRKDMRDLNGGWYGKVGDYFPEILPESYPTICMGDPLNQSVDGNDSFISVGVPSRLFVTKRVFADSITGFSREGINKSFEGYDVLISNSFPKNALCEDFIKVMNGLVPPLFIDLAADPRNKNDRTLADYEVIRCLTADEDNVVLPSTGFDPAVAPNLVPNTCQLE